MAMDSAPPILTVAPRKPRPVGRFNLYAGLTATTVAAFSYVVFLSVRTLPSEGLGVVLIGAAPICALLATPVLVSRADADADDALRWFSCGLGLAVAALFLQLMSFPAIVGDHGPLGTSNQGSAWLYLLFHLALVAAAFAAAARVNIRWCKPFVVIGALLVSAAALSFVPPTVLITTDAEFTETLTAIQFGIAAAMAFALGLWVWRTGNHASPLQGWVGVSLLLLTYETVLNAVSDRRFDADWWSSLTMRAAAFAVLAVGSILAITHQLRRFEGYSDRELSRREAELDQSIAVSDRLLASATSLVSAVRPQDVAQVLAEAVSSAISMDHVQVFDLHPTKRGLRDLYQAGITPETQPTLDGLTEVAMRGETVVLPDAEQDLAPSGTASLFNSVSIDFPTATALPLRAGGQVIAGLVAVDPRPQTWSGWTRELLLGLAAQAGPALSRARLFEREHRTAEALQLALLPERLPTVGGVDLAGRYVAGQSGVLVGGDWYDCIELPDGSVSLIVGDVMGKGIKAATLMGRLREASRVLVGVDPSPANVLDGLNDVLISADTDQIATAACLLLEPSRRKVTISLAGHPPPVAVAPDGTATTLGDKTALSPLLGLLPTTGTSRPQIVESLTIGSVLIAYTDGLIEDKSGITDGLNRLLATCSELHEQNLNVDAFARALLASRPAGDLTDDIALLVARLRP
ncbi:MAG TPA: GAF domain-containing SpoIIE family protein phosphatase [Actinomycetes bacterium]|nr:GAF domain-containing SpoIIE family protein phosphatase [Actinomycetes bacterium]